MVRITDYFFHVLANIKTLARYSKIDFEACIKELIPKHKIYEFNNKKFKIIKKLRPTNICTKNTQNCSMLNFVH